MTAEINDKVDEIMNALYQGKFDSLAEKENLESLIDDLFQPMLEAQDVRLGDLGRQLYAVTHEGADRFKQQSKDTLPLLRASKNLLSDCLVTLRDVGILGRALAADKVIMSFKPSVKKDIHTLAREIEEVSGDSHPDLSKLLIQLLSSVVFDQTMEMLRDGKLPVSINTEIVKFISNHMDGGEPDYTAMGRSLTDALADGNIPSKPINIVTSMLYWSQDTKELRKSQKARGIQKIGMSNPLGDTFLHWNTEQSLFVSLSEALEVDIGELLQSITVCFRASATTLFQRGLFIRTCPASPRPGALENVRAHTPVELRDGLSYLAEKMLDNTHPDYDPQGCLCVMRFIEPACSGVLVKGHDTIVVGPTHDGVTAGGGSNIYLTLNPLLAGAIKSNVSSMKLDDGMKHHELEFVWQKRQGLSMPSHIKSLMQDAKITYESRPIITQIRGLHEEKQPLVSPPMIDGEPMEIRGNVPQGTVVQETSLDVGAGDLKDCIALEQMAEAGDVPKGLVVYAPSASPNAHVGGVGIQWGIPVIYCPVKSNGTTWTEIQGWVTDLVDVESQPWEPSSVKEYYGMGLRDGDRYWQYQNQALSQFLHSYMSGPKNDARFEAYLAGVYSMWILKATLAVAIGEGRHAYLGAKAKFAPIHGLIHIFTTTAIHSAGHPSQEWKTRGWYYGLLRNTEVGLDNMIDFMSAYKRIFTEPSWAGSYGGQKYAESVQKGLDAAIAMQEFQHGDGSLKEVLGKVNILENAVHNCSFFFNKFISDKKFFDIGTSNHPDLRRIEWQYIVAAGFHYRFYKFCVEEPEKVSKTLEEFYAPLFEDYRNILSAYEKAIPEAYEAMRNIGIEDTLCEALEQPMVLKAMNNFMQYSETFAYCEDCDSTECGCMDGVTDFHYTGNCGWSGCNKPACKEMTVLHQHGLAASDIKGLTKLFHIIPALPENQFMHLSNSPTMAAFKNGKDIVQTSGMSVGQIIQKDGIYEEEWMSKLFHYQIKNANMNIHDINATVFTEEKRDIIESGQPYELSIDENLFADLDLPAPIRFKQAGTADVVYAQPTYIELLKILERRLLGFSTSTLIRDLKEIRTDGLGGPIDYEWLDIVGQVLDRLGDDAILQGYTSISGNMMGVTFKEHPSDLRYHSSKTSDDQMGWSIDIYTSALTQVIESRITALQYGKLNTHGSSYHFANMTNLQAFEILLNEFDIEFVKEVIQ